MSSFPAAGILNSAIGSYQQVTGQKTTVSFLTATGQTLIRFDAVLGETYQQQATPTSFPVEDGSVISDHIVRAPVTFDMLGVVTDTPLGGKDGFIREAIATVASAALPPPTIVAVSGAYSLWQSQSSSPSASRAAYATLCRMQYGDPGASPPLPPLLFTVQTKLRLYRNMMIADLQVQRDRESGAWLGFAIKLVEIVVVASQTISLGAMANAALGAARKSLGEQRGSIVSEGFIAGHTDTSNFLGGRPPGGN